MRARTDLWEPQGGNALGPPGPRLIGRPQFTSRSRPRNTRRELRVYHVDCAPTMNSGGRPNQIVTGVGVPYRPIFRAIRKLRGRFHEWHVENAGPVQPPPISISVSQIHSARCAKLVVFSTAYERATFRYS